MNPAYVNKAKPGECVVPGDYVAEWLQLWPCSRLPEDSVSATFNEKGDLVAVSDNLQDVTANELNALIFDYQNGVAP